MKSFADLVRVRNLETGAIGRIARRLFDNPKINPGILVEVDDKAKPYINYKPKFPVEEPTVEPPADEADDKEEDVTDA